MRPTSSGVETTTETAVGLLSVAMSVISWRRVNERREFVG